MYPDPIRAIQIGSSSVVKKARPLPRDRVTTTSTFQSMTFEHNYASSSTCDVEVRAADDMDISLCDDGETPSLADCSECAGTYRGGVVGCGLYLCFDSIIRHCPF